MGNFQHKHSLGQNFLKDKSVLTRIIDSVDIKEDDLIIEIGPGQGALTKYLKLFHANLICFEIDTRVKKYLDNFLDDKTDIIYQDFLTIDLNKFLADYKYNKLYVIANLPYYITTPIIEKLSNSNLEFEAMVLMVQNEVANRLSAIPGTKDYGAITVLLKYLYDVQKLFFVSRKSFDPMPKVDSAVIKLTPRNDGFVATNFDVFNKLVRDAFKMKRKNLKNNLSSYNLDIINEVLNKYGLSLSYRAEMVCLDCFIEIANVISK